MNRLGLTHTQPELIYILTETVCPGAVQDGKSCRYGRDTAGLLLTDEELTLRS